MASDDNNNEDSPRARKSSPSDVESATISDDNSDKDDKPPDKDFLTGGVRRGGWPLLEELGYRDTETSGNLIYNSVVAELAIVGFPDRMADARVAALNMRIMFKRWAKFGELDFDP